LGLGGVMVGVALFAFARYAFAWTAIVKSTTGPFWDKRLFMDQLLYALPFGGAMLVAIPQQYAHQYVVSGAVSPEAFAIYAVGCFQLPVVDLLYTPTSEVLMVRLGELDKAGRMEEGTSAFREAAAKLSLAFFPLAAFLFAAAPEFIGALFGDRFMDAVPLFRLSLLGVALAVFPIDGVLRARDQTRYLFGAYVLKAAITVPLVFFGVRWYGMVGGMASWAIAELVGKVTLMARLPRALGMAGAPARLSDCVPWRDLARASAAAAAAALGVIAVRALAGTAALQLPATFLWRALPLAVAGLFFGAAYLIALRVAGVRPSNVLASLRTRRPA
jgi:O-antigen/teichoic acid export membrane protein